MELGHRCSRGQQSAEALVYLSSRLLEEFCTRRLPPQTRIASCKCELFEIEQIRTQDLKEHSCVPSIRPERRRSPTERNAESHLLHSVSTRLEDAAFGACFKIREERSDYPRFVEEKYIFAV